MFLARSGASGRLAFRTAIGGSLLLVMTMLAQGAAWADPGSSSDPGSATTVSDAPSSAGTLTPTLLWLLVGALALIAGLMTATRRTAATRFAGQAPIVGDVNDEQAGQNGAQR